MNPITVQFKVNGKQYTIKTEPMRSLSSILRDDLLLTGTKIGCDKGECGACTVIMNDKSVDSCLVPASQINNTEIMTIEGIGDKDNLHPIQKAFIEEGAIQCGFCTPGFVMSTYALLKEKSHPTDKEIKEGLSGNLCRCTGYSKILKAVKKASGKKR